MIKIFPSLLSGDFAALGEEVKLWDALDIQGFHLDVMDGHFVPNLTFGPDMVAALRPLTQKTFDVHLMVIHPEVFIQRFIEAGADRLSFHGELDKEVAPLLKEVREQGCQTGLALNPQTPPETVLPYLEMLDFVLIMTVEPGFAGGAYCPDALTKIPLLLKAAKTLNPSLHITVDGAMGLQTIGEAVRAGATEIVSGSALFKGGRENYAYNLASLKKCSKSVSSS